MAEESIPVTPDITRPDGSNSRRNSSAGAGSANSREKTLPHYLRASTGSCHEFCKYGKIHESEEKARHPFPKRIIKKPCDEPNLYESLDLPQRKKTSAIKSKSFPNSRTHTPDTSEVIKLQVSTDSPDGNNSRINEGLSKKEKTSVAKLKSKHSPNSRSHSHDAFDVIKLEVPTDSSDSKTYRKHEILSKEKKTSMEKLRSSPNLNSRFSDAPKFIQLVGSSSSSERVGVSSKEVSSKAKENGFSKWRTTSFMLKSQAEKHPSASVPSEGLNARRNSGISDMKTGKRTATSKVSVKKVLASPSPRASLARDTSLTARKNRNLKVVPPQKNQNKVKKAETEQPFKERDECNNDTLQEKTLCVIKMETENILLESDKNENCSAELSPPVASSPKSSSFPISTPLSSQSGRDQDESEYTVTEAEDDSEYDEDGEEETVNMEEAEILEGENGGRPRKAGMVFSNDKDCQPVKLSFRRGKVIDIQSENNAVTDAEDDSEYDEDGEEETVNMEEAEILEGENGGRPRKAGMVFSNDKDCQPVKLSFRRGKVIDIQSENNAVTEAEDDSEYVEDGEEETVNMEEAEILIGENGGRPRKAGMVFSNDKDCQPVKLSFRRGEVIDIQSENNGPRRLKLRRGRVLGENQNVKAHRITFKKRGGDGDTNDNKPGREKVVLRHQDVQGKKDEKGLFNNVIEETASKLVETRKSKVKALVGAFETVISLQDTKSSANTVRLSRDVPLY
ncbi:hypothetical protein CRYUN_Cryun17cG0039900 [Craigia yunnanensis]